MKDVPWAKMYGIRNIIAHAYLKIDDQTVWNSIENDVPALKRRLIELLGW